jgi:hypothetical protein
MKSEKTQRFAKLDFGLNSLMPQMIGFKLNYK